MANQNPGDTTIAPQTAKQAIHAEGMTLKQFAETHHFKYRTVSDVVRDRKSVV